MLVPAARGVRAQPREPASEPESVPLVGQGMRALVDVAWGMALVLGPGLPIVAALAVWATAESTTVPRRDAAGRGTRPTGALSVDARAEGATAHDVAGRTTRTPRGHVATDAPVSSAQDEFAAPQVLPALPGAAGPCTLRIACRDADSGEPLATTVSLWWLSVPGDDVWTAGDARLVWERVPVGGCEVVGLHTGLYRVACPKQRASAHDPAEFVVVEGSRSITLDLRMPRSFRARAHVVDETGEPLRRARVWREWDDEPRFGWNDSEDPPWARPRRRRDGRRSPGPARAFAGRAAEDLGELWAAPGGGFDLGTFEESSHDRARDASCDLRLAGRADVLVTLDAGDAVDVEFLGIAPRLSTLVRGVRTPDGATPTIDASAISAQCRARTARGDTSDAWRAIQVDVRVRVPGYRPLAYTWSARTADASHVLVPARSR